MLATYQDNGYASEDSRCPIDTKTVIPGRKMSVKVVCADENVLLSAQQKLWKVSMSDISNSGIPERLRDLHRRDEKGKHSRKNAP